MARKSRKITTQKAMRKLTSFLVTRVVLFDHFGDPKPPIWHPFCTQKDWTKMISILMEFAARK
jgi:hypothetical protein